MKTLTKSFAILLMMMLAVSCAKDEGFLPVEEELSDALKGAKVLATPLYLSGDSYYEAFVPKTGDELFGGTLPLVATLISTGGHWYTLNMIEAGARFVDIPLKITPSGIVKGYWPDTWYDFGNPPDEGEPNTNVVAQITGHLGCDLHGPGINKGTINCTGTFDGTDLVIVFRFNGMDNGSESMDAWAPIDGPAKFEFTYELVTPPQPPV